MDDNFFDNQLEQDPVGSENTDNDGLLDECEDDADNTSDGSNEEQSAPTSGKPYYTSDEMRSLDFASVDTSRIPPEHLPFYKSMQTSFTKSKKAEREKLRQAAQQAPQSNYTPSTQGLNVEAYKQAHKRAAQIVNEQYTASGKEVDTYDPAYSFAVSDIAKQIIQEERTKTQMIASYQNEMTSAKSKYGDKFMQVDALAQSILDNEYPTATVREIQAAISVGNFAPLRIVMDEAARRLTVPANAPIQPSKAKRPPTQEGAGGKASGASPKDATARLFGI